LRGPRRGAEIPELELDVRRDTKAVQPVAIGLGALLIVGAVVFFWAGGMELVGSDFNAAITVCVVLVVAILAGLAAIAIGSRNKVVYGINGVLGGLLVGMAAVILTIAAMIHSMATACGCVEPAKSPPGKSSEIIFSSGWNTKCQHQWERRARAINPYRGD